MTQQKESVVTPERFESGMTWGGYLAHAKRNLDKFQFNYDNTHVSAEDAEALQALSQRENGPAKVLVLGEDWCPDVFRGLGVLVRMAEAAGWDLRMFPRDDNPDIMSEFLNQGEYQSIPTAAFYTRDHRYIAHFSERPAKANAEMDQMRNLFDGLDREKDIQEMRKRNDDFQTGPVWGGWRDATITEIREMLEKAVA